MFKSSRIFSLDISITGVFDTITSIDILDNFNVLNDSMLTYNASWSFATQESFSAWLSIPEVLNSIQNLQSINQDKLCLRLRIISSKPVEYELTSITVDGQVIPESDIALFDSTNYVFEINLTESLNRFKPYAEAVKAVDLQFAMIESVQAIFGHQFVYYKVKSDKVNATFKTIEDMSVQDVKWTSCLIPDNDFKDNALVYAEHGIEYDETLEIHISVEEFQRTFGPDMRPEALDYFIIPEISRIYEVTSAHGLRGFMHTIPFYKLTARKYKHRENRNETKDDKSVFDIDTIRDFNIDMYHELQNPDTKSKKINRITTDAMAEGINAMSEHMYYDLRLHEHLRSYLHKSSKHQKCMLNSGDLTFSTAQYDFSNIIKPSTQTENEVCLIYRNLISSEDNEYSTQFWFNVTDSKASGIIFKQNDIIIRLDESAPNAGNLCIIVESVMSTGTSTLFKRNIEISKWYNLALNVSLTTLTSFVTLRENLNSETYGQPGVQTVDSKSTNLSQFVPRLPSQTCFYASSYQLTNVRVYSKQTSEKQQIENSMMIKADTLNSIIIDNVSSWEANSNS